MKEKIFLLTVLSLVATSLQAATVSVNAKLQVIDPATEVVMNLSNTAMAFGDQLIREGEILSPERIDVMLEGTKAAVLTVPAKVELTSSEGAKINLLTKLVGVGDDSSGTVTLGDANHTYNVELSAGEKDIVRLEGALKLFGTEMAGMYTGTVALSASYN